MTKKKLKPEDGGRPTKMTPDTLQKLKEAFLMGMSDSLACIHADICESTLYLYCRENPEFSKAKELWKKKIGYKAVRIIDKALDDGDLGTAKFVAERRVKEDWSMRTEQTGKDGEALKPIIVYVEKEEKEAYLKQINETITEIEKN